VAFRQQHARIRYDRTLKQNVGWKVLGEMFCTLSTRPIMSPEIRHWKSRIRDNFF